MTNGYGIWIQDLIDEGKTSSTATLLKDNAAAIKIDGTGNYGRIRWTTAEITEVSGVLEFAAQSGVQTASGKDFTVGGSAANAYCNAKG